MWQRIERDKKFEDRLEHRHLGTPSGVVKVQLHQAIADESGARPGALEVHLRFPVASEFWRGPERARRGAHHGRL